MNLQPLRVLHFESFFTFLICPSLSQSPFTPLCPSVSAHFLCPSLPSALLLCLSYFSSLFLCLPTVPALLQTSLTFSFFLILCTSSSFISTPLLHCSVPSAQLSLTFIEPLWPSVRFSCFLCPSLTSAHLHSSLLFCHSSPPFSPFSDNLFPFFALLWSTHPSSALFCSFLTFLDFIALLSPLNTPFNALVTAYLSLHTGLIPFLPFSVLLHLLYSAVPYVI